MHCVGTKLLYTRGMRWKNSRKSAKFCENLVRHIPVGSAHKSTIAPINEDLFYVVIWSRVSTVFYGPLTFHPERGSFFGSYSFAYGERDRQVFIKSHPSIRYVIKSTANVGIKKVLDVPSMNLRFICTICTYFHSTRYSKGQSRSLG